MDLSELDSFEKARRLTAKDSVLTFAHNNRIIGTVTEDYQLDLFPDLERTFRLAESMGLVVNISIEPVKE